MLIDYGRVGELRVHVLHLPCREKKFSCQLAQQAAGRFDPHSLIFWTRIGIDLLAASLRTVGEMFQPEGLLSG